MNNDHSPLNDASMDISENAGAAALREVSVVGPFLPQRCRVASFSADLCDALDQEYPGLTSSAVRVDGREGDSLSQERVRYVIRHQSSVAYRNAAHFINSSHADVVCLQHERGIYGGADSLYLIDFLEKLQKPLVTTLHSIETDPSGKEQRVMDALFQKSARIVTMTSASRDLLRASYDVPLKRIDVIPQGIPDLPHYLSDQCKAALGLEGRKVLLSCGNLAPGKGVEHVIQALPSVSRQHPDVVYVVAGATDPLVQEANGESYRQQLMEKVEACGVSGHVLFVNRSLSADEQNLYMAAADICLTPYDLESRSCSATLSRMVGMGRLVISTPFIHAKELLADGRGRLVRFASHVALASAILDTLEDSFGALLMRQRAWDHSRQMTWPKVARAYMACFQAAVRAERNSFSRRIMKATHSGA